LFTVAARENGLRSVEQAVRVFVKCKQRQKSTL